MADIKAIAEELERQKVRELGHLAQAVWHKFIEQKK